jgi:hypothetical protein
MLVARAQLDFIEALVARFERPDNTMQPVIAFQSQYIAIITLLRSVGHVFDKVDCDAEDRRGWSRDHWARWRLAPIFREFIEPTRNELLKQFQGGLELGSDAFGPVGITADASMPGGTAIVTTMDTTRLRAANGHLVMPNIHQAIAFWDRCLGEAETAFGEPRR